nr:unnamed protein product [Callosobruchus analis]
MLQISKVIQAAHLYVYEYFALLTRFLASTTIECCAAAALAASAAACCECCAPACAEANAADKVLSCACA